MEILQIKSDIYLSHLMIPRQWETNVWKGDDEYSHNDSTRVSAGFIKVNLRLFKAFLRHSKEILRNKLNGMSIWSLRVLSHLVRLPGPNPSSFAPPSPWPRWTAFILFYLGPNRGSFASSSQQLFTPLLSNDGARECAKCKRLLSALLYIYVFEPFVLFTKLQCIKHLRLSYECAANALKNAESEQTWDTQLSACSASVTLVRKVRQTHIFIK